ncbi:MAG: DNA replication complex GINS family protein [Desulfurococcales archaeon]|nr:DNA replication complex GINS family protein [Desulfurococcales archaeon]
MDIDLQLELISIDYQSRLVRVIILSNIENPIPTPAGLIRVRKGDELDLPRWQAKLLEEKGIVEIKDQDLDLDTINMFHYKEKRKTAANQIVPLPQDFYPKSFELVKKLDELIRENPSHMFVKDREILEKNLSELAEARLMKIIRLATTDEGGLRDRLTPEETVVFDRLHGVISAWRRYVKKPFKR